MAVSQGTAPDCNAIASVWLLCFKAWATRMFMTNDIVIQLNQAGDVRQRRKSLPSPFGVPLIDECCKEDKMLNISQRRIGSQVWKRLPSSAARLLFSAIATNAQEHSDGNRVGTRIEINHFCLLCKLFAAALGTDAFGRSVPKCGSSCSCQPARSYPQELLLKSTIRT